MSIRNDCDIAIAGFAIFFCYLYICNRIMGCKRGLPLLLLDEGERFFYVST